jgi:hypothetical protein
MRSNNNSVSERISKNTLLLIQEIQAEQEKIGSDKDSCRRIIADAVKAYHAALCGGRQQPSIATPSAIPQSYRDFATQILKNCGGDVVEAIASIPELPIQKELRSTLVEELMRQTGGTGA